MLDSCLITPPRMKRPFHNGGGGSFIKSLQLLGRPHRHSHRSLPNERHQATPNRRPTLFGNTSRRPTRTCRFLNLLCVVDVFRFAFAFAFGPGEVQSLQHLISWETPMHSSSLSLSLIQKHLHFFCHIVYTILKISTYVSYVLPFTMTLTVNFPTHAPLTLASPIQGLRAAHGWRARRARGGGA